MMQDIPGSFSSTSAPLDLPQFIGPPSCSDATPELLGKQQQSDLDQNKASTHTQNLQQQLKNNPNQKNTPPEMKQKQKTTISPFTKGLKSGSF